MKRLFLVDAYALIFRYYYAYLGRRPMRNRAGMNTSIVYGFTKFLRDIQRREKPDLLGVAFDPKGGCFRRDIYPEYKANRPATPEDILISVPYVKRLVEAMCIPVLEVPGYEADDVIGTLARKGDEAGYEVFMVTPDKDYGQLVGENRKLYKQKGDDIEVVDKEAIKAKYGIDRPELVRDILALWGDSSDNIPGVPGVGEKGACKMVQTYGEVENIIANAENIGGKTGANILANEEQLRLAKVLTTIRLDVPIEFDEGSLTVCCPNTEALRELYTELDFKSFLVELGGAPVATPSQPAPQQAVEVTRPKPSAKPKASLEGQGSLFDAMFAPAPAEETPQMGGEEVQNDLFANAFANVATVPHTYTTIYSADELRKVVAEVATAPLFCFDIETSGFDMFGDRIVGLSLAVREHEAWYVPFGHNADVRPRNDIEAEYASILRPIFESESIAKVGQNMKFDILFLRALGIEVKGAKWDTMIMHYLLDAESRHGMDALAERYLNYSPISIESLIGKGVKQLTMDMVGVDRVAEYAAEDADITLQLFNKLRPQLEAESSLAELYHTIEEPMIDVLADMEWTGVRVDSVALGNYSEVLSQRLASIEAEIRELSGESDININSSKQLGEMLFGKMRIAAKPKMTKTKQYCTDEEYLQSFAGEHRVVDLILEYRGVKKLLSTYVDALPQLINSVTGHIHTSYNQAVTATGRLSSTNPNLQNIPVRDELGKPIRAAFVPSDERHLLLSADYSQVELRLMAHLSGDENLCRAFREGKDIHSATAALIYKKPIEEVTSEERRRAKTANFGIIYGISAFGLSQRLRIPRSEAKELIEGYFDSYPKVKEYMDRVVADAREKGYVETLFGRRRYLADIDSRNSNIRGLAERNAINAPIQGTAADIMKLAMVGVARRFKAEGIRSRITMQVHDEIVVDMLRSEQSIVEQIVHQEMEGAAKLSIPLTAECGVGENWLEAH